MSDAAILESLAQIVGRAHVLSEDVLIEGNLVEPRGLYRGRALALVRPDTTQQTADVAALCNEHGVGLVPQGGNTGLVGGQTPDESGRQLIVSMQRLNRVREIDLSTETMIVEAGVTLAVAQEAAASVDRLFPLSLASEASCTIGGNLSTNAGGINVIAYGSARDLATGVEAVLADGRIFNGLSKLRKDNTGYDLRDLFFGAEGTLGIITAAALKLLPRPRAIETAFVGVASPARALRLLTLAHQRIGGGVTSFELLPRIGIEFVLRHSVNVRDPLATHHAWYVLMEVSSQTAGGLGDALAGVLEDALGEGVIEDAAIAASGEQRAAFWRLRESLPEAQKREGASIKHDVSVPVGAVADFMDAAGAAVAAFMPAARIVAFGHLGDGNIHFNVTQPVGADAKDYLAQWEAMNDVVHAIVADFHGSISAEHGIGRLKRDLLRATKDPVALQMMRAVKAALDPNGILNPGKVL